MASILALVVVEGLVVLSVLPALLVARRQRNKRLG
jgi:hypothetical protein